MIQSPNEMNVFADLRSLSAASSSFISKDGPRLIDTALKNLIIAEGVSKDFGVCLLHRHCELGDGKAMVEFNGVSMPWDIDQFEKHGGKIVPNAWLSKDGVIYPYEYIFIPYSNKEPAPLDDHTGFVDRFFGLLNDKGLSECVGLRRTPRAGKEFLEITEGNVNIMLPSDQVPPALFEKNTTDTIWCFDPDNGFKKMRCACRNTGSADNPNHNHIDG